MTTGEALKTRGKPQFADIDFDTTPFLVFWEVTRGGTLGCSEDCRM